MDLKSNYLIILTLKRVRLDFFADKNDILIKNVFGELEDIKISKW